MIASSRHLQVARALVRHLGVNVPEHLKSVVEALSLVAVDMADEAGPPAGETAECAVLPHLPAPACRRGVTIPAGLQGVARAEGAAEVVSHG
jgi:hypothetical protein